jgi:hypothetical protein
VLFFDLYLTSLSICYSISNSGMKLMKNIWIFELESIETRCTGQWAEHIPQLLELHLGQNFKINRVCGIQKKTNSTLGAFLNFSDTNYWKSSQLCAFLELYNQGLTTSGDHFLFTDSWNPAIMQVKYMRDLQGYNWTLHGLWHAGSYDPYDALGLLIGSVPWVQHLEKSFYFALNHNYFATNFHWELFVDRLFGSYRDTWFETQIDSNKAIISGWPMEYMKSTLDPYIKSKRDLILFPHRVAEEKQVEIFRDLAKHMPYYEFIVCQDQELTKDQYHRLLGEAKMVFSANLQETLGISTCAEGPLAHAMPLAPDRLSYSEIFANHQEFLYPSKWTKNIDNYEMCRPQLINRIDQMMKDYDQIVPIIKNYTDTQYEKFFHSDSLIRSLKKYVDLPK